MPNYSKLFQDEVRRLARKEIKDDLARVKKENVELRRMLSNAKKQLQTLEQGFKRLAKSPRGAAAAGAAAQDSGDDSADRKRISSKTIQKLRTRLGLTQAEFAKLIGVTGQSVYQWEHKNGQLTFRGGAKERVLALKSSARAKRGNALRR